MVNTFLEFVCPWPTKSQANCLSRERKKPRMKMRIAELHFSSKLVSGVIPLSVSTAPLIHTAATIQTDSVPLQPTCSTFICLFVCCSLITRLSPQSSISSWTSWGVHPGLHHVAEEEIFERQHLPVPDIRWARVSSGVCPLSPQVCRFVSSGSDSYRAEC